MGLQGHQPDRYVLETGQRGGGEAGRRLVSGGEAVWRAARGRDEGPVIPGARL